MKKPPFVLRQELRRRTERRRVARREREVIAQDWSHAAYERLLADIMALDPTSRMLPSGVH